MAARASPPVLYWKDRVNGAGQHFSFRQQNRYLTGQQLLKELTEASAAIARVE